MIHPTAIIAESATIGIGTIVHPYAIIGEDTHIGRNCIIYPFAHIGSVPQVRDAHTEVGELHIGDENRFFHGSTVSRGHGTLDAVTRIGNKNLFMAYTHVGHDCCIGNHVTMANHASLAGHVHIEDHVNLGGYVGIHQFVRLGSHSFVAANSMVSQDVPPFAIVSGDRAVLRGFNRKGLARSDYDEGDRNLIHQAFRLIFGLKAPCTEFPETEWSIKFSDFRASSKRGIAQWASRS